MRGRGVVRRESPGPGREAVNRWFKLLHLVGMALFLGSIAVYITLSPWAKAGGLDRVLLARQVIALGTVYVTLPGLWVTVAAGFLFGLRWRSPFGAGWMRSKLVAGVLMLLNSHLLVAPAIQAALAAAEHRRAPALSFPRSAPPGRRSPSPVP